MAGPGRGSGAGAAAAGRRRDGARGAGTARAPRSRSRVPGLRRSGPAVRRSRSRRGAPTFCPQGRCCFLLAGRGHLGEAAISPSLQHSVRHRRHFPLGVIFLPQGRHCPLRTPIPPSEPPFPPQGCPFLPQGHHFPLRATISPSVSTLSPHSRTFSLRAAISPSGLSFSFQGGHSLPRVNTAGK